ncbi:hypothetical protein A3F66_01010 [candidate division TM6 bacterium RIFCSPHIGHO2_12_FULL_32_22]|nr:MAG: hypothetical protein A3F66_01010 [candidate division TM6 bacterium RIFCSPHIGHO2_12_FULL_32_22]
MKKLLLSILCILSLASNVKAEDKLVSYGAATFVLSAIGYIWSTCVANDLYKGRSYSGETLVKIQEICVFGQICGALAAVSGVITAIGLATQK